MKKGRKYQCYQPIIPPEQARALFIAKHGYPPDEIYDEYRLTWAGPIDEDVEVKND